MSMDALEDYIGRKDDSLSRKEAMDVTNSSNHRI